MKKLLVIVSFLSVAMMEATAQSFSFGARGGMNVANQSISASGASVSPSSKIGYLIGGYAKIMFTDNIGIQPELFFSSVGSTWPSSLTGASGDATFRMNYISIPVFFRYNVTDNFHLLAGPPVGILVTANGIYSGQTTDVKSDFNSSDIGGTFGAGMDFGPFNAGVRYNFSFGNVATSGGSFSGTTVKNNAIQIVIGYRLFGK